MSACECVCMSRQFFVGKNPKWASRGYFATYAHSAKKQEVDSDDHADQRGSYGGMEGTQEVFDTV